MKRILFILLAITLTLPGFSQDKKVAEKEEKAEKKFGVTFSGFIKNDFFYDTRSTLAAREGHFLLWPMRETLDANDKDIFANPSFNFLSIQTRLRVKIKGPDALGAKTSGLIEADFFAQLNPNINLLRLRHAFIKLNWSTTEVLTGQYWNPLFVTGCFPGTVSFNTGTPIQSFARNPQIRLTQKLGSFKLIAAILSQRDHASRGVLGPTSAYLRNSGIPDMHLQIHYETKKNEAGTGLLVGAGVAYKTIVPRLTSSIEINDSITNTYKVSEKVGGVTVMAFAKIKLTPVTIKLQGRYGENISDILSISGFAVKEITDNVTGERSYTALKNISFWAEIHTNGKKLQVGIFGGYLKNLGTKESMSDTDNAVYGLGTDIESLLRISPRIIYNINKLRLGLELEYTSASFGDTDSYDLNYVPSSTTTVANLRTLFSVYYFF